MSFCTSKQFLVRLGDGRGNCCLISVLRHKKVELSIKYLWSAVGSKLQRCEDVRLSSR